MKFTFRFSQVSIRATLLWLVISCFAGCMHKDVINDQADDVLANFVYRGKEGTFVISWEEIFQATSKESNGGVTHISGYSERRLSSYRIESGELAGRVELGETMETGTTLLGYTPGKIWMYSLDEDLGLHFRDPVTLEVKESWPQISAHPGFDKLTLAKPEWSNVWTYFGIDWESGRIMLTDINGYHYHILPETFKLEKTTLEIPRMNWEERVFGSSGQFIEGENAYLNGDPRKGIEYLRKESKDYLSFLNGQWILDYDPTKAANRLNDKEKDLQGRIAMLEDSLKRTATAHPEMNAQPDYSTWTSEKREWYYLGERVKREIEDLKRKLDNLVSYDRKVLDYPFLTSDSKSAYVRYGSSLSDTSHVLIARVELQDDSTWKQKWAVALPSVYQDANKADQAGAFETVFSKGNPSFDYAWAGTDNKHLVIVEQLRMVCIEMATGKLLWEKLL